MVLDSSAIAAIFFNEHERDELLSKLESAGHILISAATLVEITIVLRRALNQEGVDRLSRFLLGFDIEIVAFDHRQAAIAEEAFRRFGKSRHKARLNFGDCFTYALVKQTGEPLLFKGNDFSLTDLLLA